MLHSGCIHASFGSLLMRVTKAPASTRSMATSCVVAGVVLGATAAGAVDITGEGGGAASGAGGADATAGAETVGTGAAAAGIFAALRALGAGLIAAVLFAVDCASIGDRVAQAPTTAVAKHIAASFAKRFSIWLTPVRWLNATKGVPIAVARRLGGAASCDCARSKAVSISGLETASSPSVRRNDILFSRSLVHDRSSPNNTDQGL